jgi:hypothetical protein
MRWVLKVEKQRVQDKNSGLCILIFLLLELGIDLRIQDKISGLSIGSKKNHYIEEKHAAKHQREKKNLITS